MTDLPARYRTYKIRFEYPNSARGLSLLLKTTDEFAHVGKATYVVNGDQLAMLDAKKIPYEVLEKY